MALYITASVLNIYVITACYVCLNATQFFDTTQLKISTARSTTESQVAVSLLEQTFDVYV